MRGVAVVVEDGEAVDDPCKCALNVYRLFCRGGDDAVLCGRNKDTDAFFNLKSPNNLLRNVCVDISDKMGNTIVFL